MSELLSRNQFIERLPAAQCAHAITFLLQQIRNAFGLDAEFARNFLHVGHFTINLAKPRRIDIERAQVVAQIGNGFTQLYTSRIDQRYRLFQRGIGFCVPRQARCNFINARQDCRFVVIERVDGRLRRFNEARRIGQPALLG